MINLIRNFLDQIEAELITVHLNHIDDRKL